MLQCAPLQEDPRVMPPEPIKLPNPRTSHDFDFSKPGGSVVSVNDLMRLDAEDRTRYIKYVSPPAAWLYGMAVRRLYKVSSPHQPPPAPTSPQPPQQAVRCCAEGCEVLCLPAAVQKAVVALMHPLLILTCSSSSSRSSCRVRA